MNSTTGQKKITETICSNNNKDGLFMKLVPKAPVESSDCITLKP